MMIKKLTKELVQTLADVPNSEIAWAAERGMLSTIEGDEESYIAYPIYDDEYDVTSSRYKIWKQIFVARTLRELWGCPRRIFEDVADIAVAFGYPEDMRNLIYFMPAEGEASEETLLARIVNYVSALPK
jgi:hypothetical protein